jgi:hypothetical protein
MSVKEMTCEECQLMLEEYFDSELQQPAAAGVSAHVERCAQCRSTLDQLQTEHQLFLSYDRELEVRPALWAGVQTRVAEATPINTRTQTHWATFRMLFSEMRLNIPVTVGLILIAVGLTVALMKYFERPANQIVVQTAQPPATVQFPEPPKEKSAVHESLPSEPVAISRVKPRAETTRRRVVNAPQTASALVREAELKYLSAIAMLTRDVQEHPARLEHGTRVRLDDALSAIDRTIASTRKAVRRNPDDPVAVQYMLSAYRKKVDVLREMTSY